MSESMAQWLKRIGSKEALAERVRARLAGEINQQFRPIGLRANVERLMRSRPHPLACQCAKCAPYPEPVLPVKIETKSAEPKRRRKWDAGNRGGSSN